MVNVVGVADSVDGILFVVSNAAAVLDTIGDVGVVIKWVVFTSVVMGLFDTGFALVNNSVVPPRGISFVRTIDLVSSDAELVVVVDGRGGVIC